MADTGSQQAVSMTDCDFASSYIPDIICKNSGLHIERHKYNADGSLSRYKAQLVTNGSNQQQGIDCDETFSPVVKPAIIHTVLSLAATRDWLIHQLDVKNAFLHGHVRYMGLNRLLEHGFSDNIVLTASSTALLQRIITVLHGEFAITDLGSLNYFLGIFAQRTKSGLFLSQSKFAKENLERAHMQHCNPYKTPVDIESKLGSDGDSVSDPTLYRSLVSALQYLTFTRPDISYVVQQICLYMHDPRDPHFHALKRILRYVRGTIERDLQLHVSYTSQLITFTDADWVTLSRSSAEAEYRGVANVVVEADWIRNLLLELHALLTTTTLVYYDNVSVVYLSTNPVQHQRTKHIESDIHFVHDYVAFGQVRVLHVPSRFQYADIFTKGLPTALFLEFRSNLNVRRLLVTTAGEYFCAHATILDATSALTNSHSFSFKQALQLATWDRLLDDYCCTATCNFGQISLHFAILKTKSYVHYSKVSCDSISCVEFLSKRMKSNVEEQIASLLLFSWGGLMASFTAWGAELDGGDYSFGSRLYRSHRQGFGIIQRSSSFVGKNLRHLKADSSFLLPPNPLLLGIILAIGAELDG
ncbi:ribonuclease H-like domain-containing protein [Tanacetum coccineum]|uniref:Ribonuclease H-like domain-containing protein n=1 Tax=Tanacetum coccineum TaxID=301880 RepID=A0ABQ5J591_9ASTR